MIKIFRNDDNTYNNKGFSLIEIIIVISIMIILAAVLAPALLSYTEKSRAQKDDSKMNEVVNAIKIAISNQDVYDEVLTCSNKNTPSCYTENNTPEDKDIVLIKGFNKNAIDKANDQYTYNDNTRKLDEVQYYANGKMCGATITFTPENGGSSGKSIFLLKNANVNNMQKYANFSQYSVEIHNENYSSFFDTKLENITSNGYLYNNIRAVIGDEIELSSQTYRNSSFTVFIRMGSSGGNEASAQDAIKVYGQWNGTNINKNNNNTLKPIEYSVEKALSDKNNIVFMGSELKWQLNDDGTREIKYDNNGNAALRFVAMIKHVRKNGEKYLNIDGNLCKIKQAYALICRSEYKDIAPFEGVLNETDGTLTSRSEYHKIRKLVGTYFVNDNYSIFSLIMTGISKDKYDVVISCRYAIVYQDEHGKYGVIYSDVMDKCANDVL